MAADDLSPEERYPEAWLFVHIAQLFGQEVADELWRAYQEHQGTLRDMRRLRKELQKLDRKLERLRQSGTLPSLVERLERRRAIWEERIKAHSYVEDQVLLLLRGDARLPAQARERLIASVQATYAICMDAKDAAEGCEERRVQHESEKR